ncbi:MAG: F0F1 ATP synthase subunit delta [Chloroflexi bacterium]|nr:F0F1 ATP synthase subunit delta [Chloroflexota bacterium]
MVKDDQFDKLDSAKKLEMMLSLNEDQITNEAKEYFSKIKEEDYQKNDLLEAVELLSSRGNEKEEMIIYSPIELSDNIRKSINQIIENKIKNKIRIVFKIDEDLILGCRVEYKNQIQDYSLSKMSLPLINSLLKKVN